MCLRSVIPPPPPITLILILAQYTRSTVFIRAARRYHNDIEGSVQTLPRDFRGSIYGETHRARYIQQYYYRYYSPGPLGVSTYLACGNFVVFMSPFDRLYYFAVLPRRFLVAFFVVKVDTWRIYLFIDGPHLSLLETGHSTPPPRQPNPAPPPTPFPIICHGAVHAIYSIWSEKSPHYFRRCQ